MGKTGTAKLVIDGAYSDHNIYTFVGIIEKDGYQRVIVTFIKDTANSKGIYADTVAAPLFEKIAEKVLIHDKVL